MFSKIKTNEQNKKNITEVSKEINRSPGETTYSQLDSSSKPKSPPSTLSSDLTITGNLKTTGDIQVEGKVEGDIRAHLLTVGETALIKGEVIADDIVVNGRVVGRIRGLKVRLTATARVEGDIIHKTIAIESGAHFEGSVQRQEDPLNSSSNDNLKKSSIIEERTKGI
jgi:cytoskeletal protein CcmA (bactofilin family)